MGGSDELRFSNKVGRRGLAEISGNGLGTAGVGENGLVALAIEQGELGAVFAAGMAAEHVAGAVQQALKGRSGVWHGRKVVGELLQGGRAIRLAGCGA